MDNFELVKAELVAKQGELDKLAKFPVNTNSSKDLEKLFITKYGMEPIKVGVGSGRVSFAREVLEQYDTPATQLVIDVKSLKRAVMYFKDVEKFRNGEYLSFEWSEESKSGRLYAKNPAVMSFPQVLRDAIIPEPGKVFVMGSYQFHELSVIAHLTGEQTLLQDIREGKNIIAVLAEKSETKSSVVYSIVQEFKRGATLEHIAIKVFMDPIKVNFILGRIFNCYPGLQAWMNMPKQVLEQGYADSIFGERYNLDESNHDQEKESRIGVNYIGQASSASILREALRSLEEYKVVLAVHSAIIVEVLPAEVEKASQDLQERMLSILPESLTVRTSFGPSWGSLYKMEDANG